MSEVIDTQKGKYLTFEIDGDAYGLEIQHVDDIIGIQEITEVPRQPEYVQGVINLRGKIVPTMDVRLRFGKDYRNYDDRTCIVVLDMIGTPVGIVVDRVLEVTQITSDNISEPPGFENESDKKFIAGIGKYEDEPVILLDCYRLLSHTGSALFVTTE